MAGKVIQTPIVVDDNGDVSVYATVEKAEGAVEIRDLDRADLKIYDGLGRRLTATDTSAGVWECVTFHPPESDDVSDELRTRLEEYVAKRGGPGHIPSAGRKTGAHRPR